MHDFQEQCQVHGQRSKNMASGFASSTQQEIEKLLKGLYNNYQEGGGGAVNREGGGTQCKLTALGRGVTCKFLGKWGGGATEKLTLRLNYQRYFTKSYTHYFPD